MYNRALVSQGGSGQASPPMLLERQSIARQGLTNAEAQKRLATFGPNEPAPVQRAPLLRQLLLFFTNPLVLILLIASIVAGVLGEVVNAIIIGVMVLSSGALNFVQTARSRQSADRLRAQVAPMATARRDGEWKELPRRQIVPGDVIRLGAGDLIPADARLLEEHDLHIQVAALCYRAGRWANPRVSTDDYDSHAGAGSAAYGAAEGHRQASGSHAKLRQH